MPVRVTAFLLAALLVLWGCKGERGSEAKPAPPGKSKPPYVQLSPLAIKEAGLEFETVQTQPHRAMLRVPGVVKADETRLVDVSSLVPGRVIEVIVVVGDRVRPGQILARVDSTELGLAQSEYLKAQALWASPSARPSGPSNRSGRRGSEPASTSARSAR